ncbi:5722_t:CDS:2, partial [Ambispora gerdemannii]
MPEIGIHSNDLLQSNGYNFEFEDKNVIPISEEVAISPEINFDNTPTEFILPLIESQSEEEKVIIPNPMPEHNSIQGQDIIDDDTAETLDFVETINTTIETTQLEPSPIDQVQSNITSEIKIPYNQKVEQGLMGELSGYSKENIAIQDVDIQIPNLPLETILIGSDEVTDEIIANISTKSISIDSEKLPNTEVSISQINTSNKSRPSISVLPDDPKEKQKHVIKMALERFPVLSLKYKHFHLNDILLLINLSERHKPPRALAILQASFK